MYTKYRCTDTPQKQNSMTWKHFIFPRILRQDQHFKLKSYFYFSHPYQNRRFKQKIVSFIIFRAHHII